MKGMLHQLRKETPSHIVKIVDLVWQQKAKYIRWPTHSRLFMPGAVRERYHQYTPDQLRQLHDAGITPNTLSNGPAIMAFRLAGGERPQRVAPRREWSIHHIYDGKFPAPGAQTTTHAVKDGRYFTHSAGLVAVHPIADALADEVPYCAWILRGEAFRKYKFDPDGVFRRASKGR